jgi:hypothetical protein
MRDRMPKMTKAQARRRLEEARVKIAKVMDDGFRFGLSSQDMKKMYDICQYLGRTAHGPKMK